MLPNLRRSLDAPITATVLRIRLSHPTRATNGRLYNCRRVRRPVLTLLLLSVFTFFLGLGRQAITDSDEAFYAEAAREMVVGNDWLTPHFNYEERWQKPILYYWFTAAAFAGTDTTEFMARFGAALSGLGLVLLTWNAARRMFRERERRMDRRSDCSDLLRLLRDGARSRSRSAACLLHHGDYLGRAPSRQPRRTCCELVGRVGWTRRRPRLSDERSAGESSFQRSC